MFVDQDCRLVSDTCFKSGSILAECRSRFFAALTLSRTRQPVVQPYPADNSSSSETQAWQRFQRPASAELKTLIATAFATAFAFAFATAFAFAISPKENHRFS